MWPAGDGAPLVRPLPLQLACHWDGFAVKACGCGGSPHPVLWPVGVRGAGRGHGGVGLGSEVHWGTLPRCGNVPQWPAAPVGAARNRGVGVRSEFDPEGGHERARSNRVAAGDRGLVAELQAAVLAEEELAAQRGREGIGIVAVADEVVSGRLIGRVVRRSASCMPRPQGPAGWVSRPCGWTPHRDTPVVSTAREGEARCRAAAPTAFRPPPRAPPLLPCSECTGRPRASRGAVPAQCGGRTVRTVHTCPRPVS